jgi:Na+/proline symporter
MITSKHGYVLLIVLIFMQIFAWIGLQGLSYSITILKTNRLAWQRLQHIADARKILRGIAVSSNCLVPQMAAHFLKRKSLHWWEKKACHGSNYHYVIEFLGTNACALIQWKNKLVSSQFYRLSLLLVSDQHFDRMILQTTIALPYTELLACEDKNYQINSGEHMFREL